MSTMIIFVMSVLLAVAFGYWLTRDFLSVKQMVLGAMAGAALGLWFISGKKK